MATLSEVFAVAVEHHQAGRLREAEAIYRQILQVAPQHADALHLLGVLAHRAGHHQEAVRYIGQAITHDPRRQDFYNNLADAYRAQGKLAEAEAHYRQALALRPDYAEAHYNLGNTLKAQGRLKEAEVQYRRALAANPALAEVHNNLGNVSRQDGKLAEAEAHYRQALALRPDYAEAYNNLGVVLQDQAYLDKAVVHYRQALALRPAYAEAHYNLANTLKEHRRLADAVAHYRQALALRPDYAEAYNNLGLALEEQGHLHGAVTHFERALALRPAYADAYYNLANTLKAQGKLEEAVAYYRKALALRPDFVEAENQLMHQLQYLCDWTGLEELYARQRHLIRTNSSAKIAPFTLLAIPSSPMEQLRCATNWAANSLAPLMRLRERLGFHFTRVPKPRLRIGYLSGDFRHHAIARLIPELFETHDRARFEVLAYSYGPDDKSDIRQRIERACDRFVEVREASSEETARQIYDDGVDILVDLMGYTGSSRTPILALRPAPLQVNYLGFPGTMGADFMDYIITDRFIAPANQAAFFTEQFVYLPDCYQANDRQRLIAEHAPTRTECSLPAAGLIFCCFNNTYKITPAMFDIWMRLLRALPGSVLWLLESGPGATRNLRREAAVRGVDPERLVFAPRLPNALHLARYPLADLFLDTLPVNAHATCSDALWAGLPVLTCVGETFVSRVAGSLLRAIGLPELITYSLEDYEAVALRLAQHPDELAALRARLAQNRLTAPLFDTPRFTRHLERAYELMWDLYLRGQAPRQIEVPASPNRNKG
jgi:predicted O-linked N-acetylglucosamine transferase (SPINDLY family)